MYLTTHDQRPAEEPTCLDPAVRVLWLDSTRLRVGLDPDHHVVVPHATRGTVDRLRGLKVSDDLRRSPGRQVAADDPAMLHRRLAEAGLLACGGPWRPARTTWVQVVGSGTVATTVTTALQTLTLGRCDSAPTPASMAPDLVVIAPDQGRGDAVAAELQARGITHLWAHLRDGRAVVGPLVEPGRTACLRCHDLFHAARDPAWPALAVQWEQAPPAPVGPSVTLLAGLVVRQVHQWLVGQSGAGWGATLQESPTGAVDWQIWPMHPDCGCAAVPAARPCRTRVDTQ
jgi:hypothetical protein